MLRQGKYREHDAIYVKSQTSTGWAYTIYPGYYLKHGEDESAEYYQVGGGNEAGYIEKAALADPWKMVMAKKEKSILCVITVFNVATCGDESGFDRLKKTFLSQDPFQQTLIYSGKVGKRIYGSSTLKP
ncbi:MAG: hypothetical protein H0X02_04925 [Nitrosomonas sp.]|nr:hypothetical protein [Nitrosomonas sp.]